LEALRSTEALLAQVQEAHRWVNKLAPTLDSEIQAIFADVPGEGITDDPTRMETLADAIEIRLRRYRLESARKERNRLRDIFKAEPFPVFRQVTAFLDHFIGNLQHESLSVEKGWQTILEEIERLSTLRSAFVTISEICAEVAACGAVEWARCLATEPVCDGGLEWTPSDWVGAWKWSRQFGYLRGIDGRERVQSLAEQRLNLQNDLSAVYTRLVEQLTWLNPQMITTQG
jgi:hypothetical protein